MKYTLSDLRDKVGLTQQQLSVNLSDNEEGVTISKTAISLYEIGLRKPPLKKAIIIARYFGLPVEAIHFGSDGYEMKTFDQSTGTDGS